MPETILEATELVKKYGDLVAVNNASFTMEAGEVFGLLGPNGAGKSTTISMLTCLFPPTSGAMRIFGRMWSPRPTRSSSSSVSCPRISPSTRP